MSKGFTVVPLYPNWSSETQLEYIEAYHLRTVCVGPGFRSRVEDWALDASSGVDQVLPIDLESLRDEITEIGEEPIEFDIP